MGEVTESKVGFDDSAIYGEFTQPHAEREIPMIPMMREKALAALAPGGLG